MINTAKRAPRRPEPLSAATHKRLLRELLERADAGDAAAAEALIRLSLKARQPPASDAVEQRSVS